ncbi:MAG: hypothetical protein AAGD18_00025 [Actinomycetota bacterium]
MRGQVLQGRLLLRRRQPRRRLVPDMRADAIAEPESPRSDISARRVPVRPLVIDAISQQVWRGSG